MNRRQTAKQQTRELILQAARILFREKGPERCTMRDIARRAGVSAASVVVHFNNKTALLEAALSEDIEQAIGRAVATMPDHGFLLDRLMHIARHMYTFYSGDRELYRVLIRNTVFEAPEESPALTEQMEHYMAFFAGLIETEKKQGRVRFDADSRVAATSLFSLYFSVLMELLRNPSLPVETALAQLAVIARQHLAGILVQGEENDPHP